MKRHALPFLLGLAGCASSEWVRDYDGQLPGAHPPSVYAAMVVDAARGTPISGARLRLYREDTRPEALPGELVHEAKADEFGVVSLAWRDEYAGCHFVFDATGYAPTCDLGAPGDRVALVPGRTWHGQLLDPEGAPAAGVALEYFTGCPHSPALRTATTDAQGRFALWDIGTLGFLWAPAPRAAARPHSLRALPVPGHVLEPILPDPGVTVTGTVYDAKERPAKGAIVYSTQDERGPKTATAADGTFTLHGIEPNAEVLFGAPGAHADMERTAPMDPPPPASPPSNVVRVRPPDPSFLFFAIGMEGSVEADEKGLVELHTPLRGPVRISFRHERNGDGEIVADVDADVVDVPPTAFRVPGFLDAPSDAAVSVFDAEGAWGDAEGTTSWQYRSGARLRLAREGHATNYRRLSGRGPYAVGTGSATLEIRTGDVRGAVAWVDGERFAAGAIRGLDAGPHTVLVSAPGRRGKALLVVLADGETRPLDVRLEKR